MKSLRIAIYYGMHGYDFHKVLLFTLSVASIQYHTKRCDAMRWWRWMLRFRCIFLHSSLYDFTLNLSLKIFLIFDLLCNGCLSLWNCMYACMHVLLYMIELKLVSMHASWFCCCGFTYLHAHWSVNIHSFCYLNNSWIDVPVHTHTHTHWQMYMKLLHVLQNEDSFGIQDNWCTHCTIQSTYTTTESYFVQLSVYLKKICIFSVIRFFNF